MVLAAAQKNMHEDIISLCLQGDNEAQHKLYNLYSRAMYNICYRMCNSAEEAEDVLQESFISAFRNLDRYKGTASFGAWLKRIVINNAINQIRKRKLNLVPIDDYDVVSDESCITSDEELYLDVQRIKEAIKKLPDGYRIVFSLYLLEGYDHREIGEILGITESTSKSQYNRAKNKLQQLLNEQNYEGGYARG
jgi:RNA polymerase sigma-70 factor (ECF subfamily)